MEISRRRFFGGGNSDVLACRPPWSLADGAFETRCSRCGDCVKICPTGLLRNGDAGFPVADFTLAACTSCGDCASVCTVGAIDRQRVQQPWLFDISIDSACIANRGVECRVCSEACDVGAIQFRPRIGGVPLPELDETACTGCGACLAPCPVGALRRVVRSSAKEFS